MEIFCILLQCRVGSTHHLPLRFGKQVPNMMCTRMVQNLKSCIVQKFCTTGGQSLLSLPGTNKKNFSFHFERYNLTIRTVNFFEFFCTCSPSSLVQNPTVKIPKIEKNPIFAY
jgi:hypothetical protein